MFGAWLLYWFLVATVTNYYHSRVVYPLTVLVARAWNRCHWDKTKVSAGPLSLGRGFYERICSLPFPASDSFQHSWTCDCVALSYRTSILKTLYAICLHITFSLCQITLCLACDCIWDPPRSFRVIFRLKIVFPNKATFLDSRHILGSLFSTLQLPSLCRDGNSVKQ